MFSVIFEAHPRPDQWDAYLGHARMFRPEFEQIEGFVDNIRYPSLTREGWILSLSGWRDETETGDANHYNPDRRRAAGRVGRGDASGGCRQVVGSCARRLVA